MFLIIKAVEESLEVTRKQYRKNITDKKKC